MEKLMALQKYVRQLRPIQENKVDYVERFQDLFEAKGLNIDELRKLRGDKPKLYTLIDVINNKTKIETTQGKTSLSWISNVDKTAMEMDDLMSAFVTGKRYKPVFITDNGKKIKLNDILKTKIFGGGKGSGGGSENTDLTECAQCIYTAAIFNGAKLSDGDSLSGEEYGAYSSSFDIDTQLPKIAKELTDDWIASSILIGNELKRT